MKIVIDMNLSPDWVSVFQEEGWEAVHWSQIGNPKTSDNEIMQWARTNEHVVFTHDLDFGVILATCQASGPSVIQVRTQNVHPSFLKKLVFKSLDQFRDYLEKGALVTVDEAKNRVRLLPILDFSNFPRGR